MLRFRVAVGVFIWWLFLFYNVERINSPINISSFVYVLAPVTAGFVMLLPQALRRTRILLLIVPTLVVYFALKIFLGYETLGQGLTLTVTEVVSLVITLLLARQMAVVVWDFEDTVGNLTFQQLGVPPRFLESIDAEELYREVKRSRRFQHPLSLLVVQPEFDKEQIDLNRVLLELQETMVSRYVQARIANLLSEELADSDVVVQNGQGFVVLLVETPKDASRKVAERLRSEAQSRLGLNLSLGIADFPDTSVTFGGLLEAATKNLLESRPLPRERITAAESQADGGVRHGPRQPA